MWTTVCTRAPDRHNLRCGVSHQYGPFRLADFNLEYVRETGLKTPLHFEEREHLGMMLPKPDFTVTDVM